MSEHPDLSPVEASEAAVHKARSALMAIEVAREIQNKQMVEETVLRTKDALLESLKEVFGESDNKDPEQMKILVRRIPILCTNVITMHDDIAEIKDNLKWGIRLVLGAVILGVLKVALLG